jgi:hypothetical protein
LRPRGTRGVGSSLDIRGDHGQEDQNAFQAGSVFEATADGAVIGRGGDATSRRALEENASLKRRVAARLALLQSSRLAEDLERKIRRLESSADVLRGVLARIEKGPRSWTTTDGRTLDDAVARSVVCPWRHDVRRVPLPSRGTRGSVAASGRIRSHLEEDP